VLLPMPARPYRSLVLAPAPTGASDAPPAHPPLPDVAVERRALSTYATLAAGGDA
jgi:hypothetical protein